MVNWPKQRAWGWYATLIRTPWFCLKLLRFKNSGILSMQRHKHRTELWLFIKGQGRIEYAHSGRKYHASYRALWFNKRFDLWRIKPNCWHKFTALDQVVYAIELQYGRKVTESDIERK